ncbi:MAG TPA: TasA family protein [Nocardioides sp.]|nr:TasA family protein [Nocardioides sp.]
MQMSRKILVPLATLTAAGAIAVGSGATFTSQSNNTISAVTSGTLTQANSKDGGAVFDLTNMKPGDTLNGSLTLTNTGSLPAAFSLTETASTNGFTGENLSLVITNTTTGATVYSGTFGGLVDGTKTELGVVQPSVENSFRFTVKLATTAPNADQGKSASAAYRWDSVQLDGVTYEQ